MLSNRLFSTLWAALWATLFTGFGAWLSPPAFACTLLVLGDSISAGYGLANKSSAVPAQLENAINADPDGLRGKTVTIRNGGVSGDTTRDLRERLAWSMQGNPDAVLVMIGGNDVLRSIDPEATAENLKIIVSQVVNEFSKPMGLVGIATPASFGSDYNTRFASAYTDVAQTYDIPLYPNIFQGIMGDITKFQQDGIHPNTIGATEIAKQLAVFVRPLVNRSCY